MLHLITPVYRPSYLEKVYNSIPSNKDIIWHISKSKKTKEFNFDFLTEDSRIKLYEIDCEDRDIISKRNVIFDKISDGYIHLLDDDTEFHENMYTVYQKYSNENFVGMIVGQQLNKNRTVRLSAKTPPLVGAIDTGNVLCHSIVLKTIRWGNNEKSPRMPRDFYFWKRTYEFFGTAEKINEPISLYNSLR